MEQHYEGIENLLQKFSPQLGGDYQRYKNHVCRVYANCLLLDPEKANEEKYAIAAVFHDLGIWTDHTLDYLDPSVAQAKTYLQEIGKDGWSEEIALMIYWHHKMSPYKGKYQEVVENFRKADWIDVSVGLLSFGVDKNTLRQNRKQLPNLGFHWFLIRGTFKNLFRHPLNPLPMFKR